MEDLQLETVTEEEIRHIKAELEARYLGKLSRTTLSLHPNGQSMIRLICKNNMENKDKCPFLVEFYPYGDKYFMKQKSCEHLPSCRLDINEAAFATNKLILDSYREDIIKILKINPLLKPKEILDMLIQKLELEPSFLFAGLEGDKNFERRMKKKFDNTILEIRNQLQIDLGTKKTRTDTGSKGKATRRRISKKFTMKKTHREYSSSDDSSFMSFPSTRIQIFNNVQMFISNTPAIELINDHDPSTMKIHLVNRSKEKTNYTPTRTCLRSMREFRPQLKCIDEKEEVQE